MLSRREEVPSVPEIGTRDADALAWFRTEGEVVSVSPNRIQATLAFAGGFDGLAIPHGAELGLGLGFDWLMIAITGRIGLPSVVDGEHVTLALEHHRVAVRGSFALLDEALLRITFALDLGASLITRTTIAVAPGLNPTASALMACVSVGASARLIVWLAPSLGPTLDLGAEINTPTPRYQGDDAVAHEPWPVLLRGLGGFVVEAPFL